MIVALLSLIVAMLTGGHRSPSAIRDLQKRVRKYVKEPDRKKQVLEILKTQVAARKRLNKRVKQYQTMLRQLAGDRETTREPPRRLPPQSRAPARDQPSSSRTCRPLESSYSPAW